ncbi:putative beta-galactosidase [Seiridium cardinale]|uniref:Beta-galactosidase n=1 Tax=Seiridium cardinale TaxID=138064 RepID=A0ABR2XFJ9_9PEZI
MYTKVDKGIIFVFMQDMAFSVAMVGTVRIVFADRSAIECLYGPTFTSNPQFPTKETVLAYDSRLAVGAAIKDNIIHIGEDSTAETGIECLALLISDTITWNG